MECIGIGVDIEAISRFRHLRRTHDRHFLERIFTIRELNYCFSKKDPAQHLAVRFCGKEAAVKALASIGIHAVGYCTIEICNNEKGVPFMRLPKKQKSLQISVSLSHSKEYAIAFVTILYDRT
ncbi:holo-ACP synthase [Candidatus Uhrbacteria bacterium]|nr:holo-ACP synthase [Candidatus Uhrbacteria bacterium]